jgi:hypothetical protein
MVPRTATFFLALAVWMFGPMFALLYYLAAPMMWGAFGAEDHIGTLLVVAGGLGLLLAWLVDAKVPAVWRAQERMCSWGLGVAQLTFCAYVVVMPFFVIAGFFQQD